ncbi:MAG TPA: hypothetical protein VH479_00430 [Acidimicrobiales bacterium]|jgi:hypothetical protein
MRRLLLLLLAVALGGLVFYRARMLDQRERRLGIGRYDGQSASEPSSRSNHTFTSIPPP